MRKILEYLDKVDDELCDAKNYAESYLQFRVEGDQEWADKFKAMSEEELNHALSIQELSVQRINKIKSVYTPPTEIEETWHKSHARYLEEVAWIKQMLSM